MGMEEMTHLDDPLAGSSGRTTLWQDPLEGMNPRDICHDPLHHWAQQQGGAQSNKTSAWASCPRDHHMNQECDQGRRINLKLSRNQEGYSGRGNPSGKLNLRFNDGIQEPRGEPGGVCGKENPSVKLDLEFNDGFPVGGAGKLRPPQ
ncbi:unnamed protein product, partial [Notodromas monacha]